MKKLIGNLFKPAFTASYIFLTLLANPDSANATGVIGGYKFVRASNHGWGSSLIIKSTAYKTFGSVKIHHVNHKANFSHRYSNPWVGYTNNAFWRPVNLTSLTNPNGEGEYNSNYSYPLAFFNKDKDVMVSQHVYRTINGITTYVFDPGGIINLGKIEPNSCRQYENGKYIGW